MVIFREPVPGATPLALSRFLARARRAVKLSAQITVLITSSRELRALNRRFRGQDKPTDVLSFSSMDHAEGDIAISAEIATDNAKRLGHPPADELKVLALHGILHLAGYDHESDGGEMARKESALRRVLRLPAALTERASDNGGRPAIRARKRT